jgi:hypothetical protein
MFVCSVTFMYNTVSSLNLLVPQWGHAIVQLVAALCYNPERRGFDSRDDVTGIFHWHNPSGYTVALGLTKPVTEMIPGIFPWGCKGGRCVGLTTLPPSCADLGASTSWNPQGLSRPVMGLLYLTCLHTCMIWSPHYTSRCRMQTSWFRNLQAGHHTGTLMT